MGFFRVAHRGASGSAPELTRAAFERALELGVDMIELDVRLSADSVPVVFHDDDLRRTTNGRGRVRERTVAELRELDAGSWFGPAYRGERILTLEEVVELVGRRALLNVELKGDPPEWKTLALRTLAVLARAGIVGTTVISCFDPEALAKVREFSPGARIGLLWNEPDFGGAWPWAKRLAAWSIHPRAGLVTERIVREAHARGLRVLAWTVNDVGEMARLVEWGVDGIMTDYPERFALLDSEKR
ncbi:MAG: glycerophosphoryl diester phosphodiesterase [Candidatus Binatia bacterium]|nr:MAG: glycerophosphoryl diester phosphodiesterase [Candidatus Binatia bacterium]